MSNMVGVVDIILALGASHTVISLGIVVNIEPVVAAEKVFYSVEVVSAVHIHKQSASNIQVLSGIP